MKRIRTWQDEDGRWWTEWLRPNGKRTWVAYRTEQEAMGVR